MGKLNQLFCKHFGNLAGRIARSPRRHAKKRDNVPSTLLREMTSQIRGPANLLIL